VLPGASDTIAAIATAPGRGAIALIRVSGSDAHALARRHVAPWPASPRVAALCTIRDAAGAELDRALVTRFDAPHSFTGEDLVEIATHGGAMVPTLVMEALIDSGAREAAPGEFTRRAVLAGKLDLAQAEALGDLVDAGTRGMHRAALAQLDGGLSRRIGALREEVLSLEALLAYDIDFPEEDDGPIPRTRVSSAARALRSNLSALLDTAPGGEVIRTGALVVIAGAPNAGKSSLFNALLGRERAIVTPIAGTTRDAIEVTLDMGGWPVRLVDTAGLRETTDVIERLGVEVSERYLRGADVVLVCGESDEAVAHAVALAQGTTAEPGTTLLPVRTKGDLGPGTTALTTSAVSGAGIRDLVHGVARALDGRYGKLSEEMPALTRVRHARAVREALDETDAFLYAWDEGELPATVAAVHLRAAADALHDVIGSVDTEDVMDRLFRTFCVGK